MRSAHASPLPPPAGAPPQGPAVRLGWIDFAALLLVLVGGMFSVLDNFQENHHEMIPLVAGLALLLLNHSRAEPIRWLYLLLLLFSMRVYLHSDERYESWEITLHDYILVIIAFAATFRLPQVFWKTLLPLITIFVPLAGLLSLQLHLSSTPWDLFNAGTLSINQTACLFGACLTMSLCLLWNALTARRSVRRRLLLVTAWLLSSLLDLVLILETGSRSGLGLPLAAVGMVLLLAHRQRIRRALSRVLDGLIGGVLQAPLQALGIHASRALAAVALLLMSLSLLIPPAAVMLRNIYSSQQNVISDLHRLHLLRCYFGALFSGNNRFIWGMGFTNASNFLCKDVGLIKGTTHAHNIFAQVAADTGFFAMLALLLIFGWLLLRGWRRLAWCGDPMILTSCCLFLYLFLFMQIEGGWGKVTFLQTLTGLAMASLTMPIPGPAFPGTGSRGKRDHGTRVTDP